MCLQQIRFTPPREVTPPPPGMDEFKSEQRITLYSGVTPIAYGRPRTAQAPPKPPPSRPRRRVPPPGNPAQWMPSPEEVARARAQIGSEVLQWHARRSSRSISIDESSSAATSEPQSPTADHGEWTYQTAMYGADQNSGPVTPPSPAPPQQQQQPQTMTSSTVLVFKSPTLP